MHHARLTHPRQADHLEQHVGTHDTEALTHVREVHLHGEDVGLGHHPGVAPGLHARQVALSRRLRSRRRALSARTIVRSSTIPPANAITSVNANATQYPSP